MDGTMRIGIRQRACLGFEAFFLERLVPKDHVSRGLRRLFRVPLFLRRIGLGIFLPHNVLILTTTGRFSGRPHMTPVEFGPGPRPGSLMVMSGWDGHTDWYRNARRQPSVRVWLRGKEWDAMAEPVPDPEVAQTLKEMVRMWPASRRIWSRWAGFELDGSNASYLAAAAHFPSLYLAPARGGSQRSLP